MHICFICVEIFAWGKYGGFGRATRTIGRELVRRGIRVSAVVPLRADQRKVENLDGITVYAFPMRRPGLATELYRACDADIYHSQEPSWGTVLAQRAMPRRKHVVTFRYPRTAKDWFIELSQPSSSRLQVLSNLMYEDNPLVQRAARRADARFCAAEHLIPKVVAKYRLGERLEVLPTPVEVPEAVRKSEVPTVCFNARWDKRKRPELYFELAAKYPAVRFIAIGRSRDASYEASLRSRYAHLTNIEWVGFLDQFASDRLSQLLSESWILVNTASREGLPNSFIEAAAHGCAILSAVNPDDFASRFGYHAADDDFDKGLAWLLEKDRWRAQGQLGREHVRSTFATDSAMDRHVEAYRSLLPDHPFWIAPSLLSRTATAPDVGAA